MADKMNTDYWNKFYGGGMSPSVPFIPEPGSLGYSAGPTFQPGMMGRGMTSVGSPNLTAAEQQLLNQQIQQSQALQAGYNPNGTPKPLPAVPSVGIPAPATFNSIDQAGYNAINKPGTWMAQSRTQAQALMRQMALRNAGVPGAVKPPVAAPVVAAGKPKSPGLFDLLVGGDGRNQAGGGLAALIAQQRSAQPYGGRYTPQELADRTAQGIAIGNANRASATPTYDASGNNNAFMSTAHQNSVRKQTGY